MPPTDWIVKPATLDRYDIDVRPKEGTHGAVKVITITGWCDRRRKHLWFHRDEGTTSRSDWMVHDIILHLTLVCEQDRPVNQAQMDRALFGGVQLALPFEDSPTEPF